jgi:hypothetical protein
MTPKARHPVSCIALAVIWQLVTLIPSTHAQTELHSTSSSTSTSSNLSDACTRALETDGSTGALFAHFPCLPFTPLLSTTAEAASPLSFSLSAQETPSVLSSSLSTLHHLMPSRSRLFIPRCEAMTRRLAHLHPNKCTLWPMGHSHQAELRAWLFLRTRRQTSNPRCQL